MVPFIGPGQNNIPSVPDPIFTDLLDDEAGLMNLISYIS